MCKVVTPIDDNWNAVICILSGLSINIIESVSCRKGADVREKTPDLRSKLLRVMHTYFRSKLHQIFQYDLV